MDFDANISEIKAGWDLIDTLLNEEDDYRRMWKTVGAVTGMIPTLMGKLKPIPMDYHPFSALTITTFIISALGSIRDVLDVLSRGGPVIENYLRAIQIPSLRQYWNLYQAGYIDKNDLLAFSGARDMLHFYQVIGCDPSFIGPIKEQRQNGLIDDAQMVARLALNDVAQADALFGEGWRAAVDLADDMRAMGVEISFGETKQLLDAVVCDVTDMTAAEAAMLRGMTSQMREIGLQDLRMEDRASIIRDAFVAARETLFASLEDEDPVALDPDHDPAPVLAANALSSVTRDGADRVSYAEAHADHADHVFSNIALALRQLEPEEKGISDAWRGDVFQSSFQSVSFASPFEDRERSLGAELRSAL